MHVLSSTNDIASITLPIAAFLSPNNRVLVLILHILIITLSFRANNELAYPPSDENIGIHHKW